MARAHAARADAAEYDLIGGAERPRRREAAEKRRSGQQAAPGDFNFHIYPLADIII
jgi:hypothetical protein